MMLDGTMELGDGSFTGVCSGDAGKVAWLARSVPRRVGLAWPWVHYVEILFPYILMSQEI